MAIVATQPQLTLKGEDLLQETCINWFRCQHPQYAKLLYSIPNGGFPSEHMRKKMKATGLLKGAADLCLALPNYRYHSLYMELKIPPNKQSEYQLEFERNVTRVGFSYEVICSQKEFQQVVNQYLSGVLPNVNDSVNVNSSSVSIGFKCI